MYGNIGLMQNLLNNVQEKILFILNQFDILSYCFIPAISSIKKKSLNKSPQTLQTWAVDRPPPATKDFTC